MRRKILLSIKTKYSNEIFNGYKIYEFRKVIPKIKDEDELVVVVYSSEEEKAIAGEFKVSKIFKCSFDELMKKTGNIKNEEDIEYLKRYFKDKSICYAFEITNVNRYKNPIKLEDIVNKIPNFRAPQNFIYINDEDELDILLKEKN